MLKFKLINKNITNIFLIESKVHVLSIFQFVLKKNEV